MKLSLVRAITALGLILAYLTQPVPGRANSAIDALRTDSDWTYIAYIGKDGSVWLAPFYVDPPSLGDAFVITDRDAHATGEATRFDNLSWSPDGMWLAYLATWDTGSALHFYNVLTKKTQIAASTFAATSFRGDWSSAGSQYAVNLNGTLGVVNPASGETRELITPPWDVVYLKPTWSPDGRKIALTGGSAPYEMSMSYFGVYDLDHQTFYDWRDKCGNPSWDKDSLGLYCDSLERYPGAQRYVYYRSADAGAPRIGWSLEPLIVDTEPQVVLGGGTIAVQRSFFYQNRQSEYIDYSSLVLLQPDGSAAVSIYTTNRPYPNFIQLWNSDLRTVAVQAWGPNAGGETTVIDAAERRVLATLGGHYNEWGPSPRFIMGYQHNEEGIRLYDLQTMKYWRIEDARLRYAWQPVLVASGTAESNLCGQWQLSNYTSASKPRVLVSEVANSMETTCQGVYEFANDTSVRFDLYDVVTLLDVGNYSMSLTAHPTGGTARFPLILERLGPRDADSREEILTSYLPVQLEAKPDAPATTADVRIEAKTTVESFAWDLTLLGLNGLLELAPGLSSVPIPTETMTKLALRGAYLFDQAAEYALSGDMSAAYSELKVAISAFGDLISDELANIGMEMLAKEFVKDLSQIKKLKVALNLITYVGNRVYDGFAYGKEPDLITLTYAPAQLSAATPVSGSTSIPVPTPTSLKPDTSDLASTVGWLMDLIEHKKPSQVADLVGPVGTKFVPYGVGADLLGYDNREEVVYWLDAALTDSEPTVLGCETCVGCAPDKAAVYYRGVRGLGPSASRSCEATGFVFFQYDGIWQLVYITCVDQMNYFVSEIMPCSEVP